MPDAKREPGLDGPHARPVAWKPGLHRFVAIALGAACVIKAWQRGGDDAALAVGAGVAVLLAMIWFNRLFAAALPRRGSSMLGTPHAHHVEPVAFTLAGWGVLAFVAWVLFTPR
jgi:hypothetical protein